MSYSDHPTAPPNFGFQNQSYPSGNYPPPSDFSFSHQQHMPYGQMPPYSNPSAMSYNNGQLPHQQPPYPAQPYHTPPTMQPPAPLLGQSPGHPVQPQPHTQQYTQQYAQQGPQPQTYSQPYTQPYTQTQPQSQPYVQPQPQPQSHPHPHPHPHPHLHPQSQPQPQPQSQSQLQYVNKNQSPYPNQYQPQPQQEQSQQQYPPHDQASYQGTQADSQPPIPPPPQQPYGLQQQQQQQQQQHSPTPSSQSPSNGQQPGSITSDSGNSEKKPQHLSRHLIKERGRCLYFNKRENVYVTATIQKVHFDDDPPYVTILIDNAENSRQTELDRIFKID